MAGKSIYNQIVDFPAMFYLAMIFPAIAAIASGSTPQLSHLSVFV